MDSWRRKLTPCLSGRENMRLDLEAFNTFESGETVPSLRIYSWKPNCISLGHSQIIVSELDQAKANKLGWDVIQRPTGGGIVFHNEAEVTYSLVMAKDDPILPKGLVPAYKKISEAVVIALKNCGVPAKIRNSQFDIRHSSLCFSYPAEYEIVCDGKKIVGSAQKRGRRALLQQGSIFVRSNPPDVYHLLKQAGESENAISVEELLGRKVEFDELKTGLIEGFEEVLGISFDEI